MSASARVRMELDLDTNFIINHRNYLLREVKRQRKKFTEAKSNIITMKREVRLATQESHNWQMQAYQFQQEKFALEKKIQSLDANLNISKLQMENETKLWQKHVEEIERDYTNKKNWWKGYIAEIERDRDESKKIISNLEECLKKEKKSTSMYVDVLKDDLDKANQRIQDLTSSNRFFRENLLRGDAASAIETEISGEKRLNHLRHKFNNGQTENGNLSQNKPTQLTQPTPPTKPSQPSQSSQPNQPTAQKSSPIEDNVYQHRKRIAHQTLITSCKVPKPEPMPKSGVQCGKCKRIFQTDGELSYHTFHVCYRPFVCNICTKSLTSTRTLSKHKLKFHSKEIC